MTVALPAAAPPSDRPVILVLARLEAVRIVLHPAFVVGLVASALTAWRAVVTDTGAPWPGAGYQQSMVSWSFAGLGTLVAAALATGRGRMLDDVDLFEGTPLPPARRVLALALALVAPVGLVAVAVTVLAVTVADRGGFRQADPPYSLGLVPVSAAEWAHLPAAVLLAGLVGVAVASLPRARALVLVLVTTVGFLSSAAYWAVMATPLRVLHPLVFATTAEPLPDDFDLGTWDGERALLTPDEYSGWREVHTDLGLARWHLVGLVGLCLLALGVAMWSADRSERWARPLVLVGGAVGAGGLVAQLLLVG